MRHPQGVVVAALAQPRVDGPCRLERFPQPRPRPPQSPANADEVRHADQIAGVVRERRGRDERTAFEPARNGGRRNQGDTTAVAMRLSGQATRNRTKRMADGSSRCGP